MGLTDKQYDGMLKEQIASFDRIAKATKDVDDCGLYDEIIKK